MTFEMTTCTRCGGTGQMPFAVAGGACFKCHRKGEVMTPKGRAAHKRINEWAANNLMVEVGDLAPGDRIMASNRALGGPRVVAQVLSIEPAGSEVDGEETVSVHVSKGVGMIAPRSHKVQRAWTNDTIRAAYATVSRMSGVTLQEV